MSIHEYTSCIIDYFLVVFIPPRSKVGGHILIFFPCLSFCHLPKTVTLLNDKYKDLSALIFHMSILCYKTLPFCNVTTVLMKQFSGLSILPTFQKFSFNNLSMELVTLWDICVSQTHLKYNM